MKRRRPIAGGWRRRGEYQRGETRRKYEESRIGVGWRNNRGGGGANQPAEKALAKWRSAAKAGSEKLGGEMAISAGGV